MVSEDATLGEWLHREPIAQGSFQACKVLLNRELSSSASYEVESAPTTFCPLPLPPFKHKPGEGPKLTIA